jgi:hypothetical protein
LSKQLTKQEIDTVFRKKTTDSQTPLSKYQITIIAGRNRTGTSLLMEILVRKGFQVPRGVQVRSEKYTVYENQEFKKMSRLWN